MPSSPSTNDDDLPSAEVERRREPRGLFPGLSLSIAGRSHPVLEASRRGFFLQVHDPESMALGKSHPATLTYQEQRLDLSVEVVRKEIDPRRGIAVRVVAASRETDEALRRMLAVAEVPPE